MAERIRRTLWQDDGLQQKRALCRKLRLQQKQALCQAADNV